MPSDFGLAVQNNMPVAEEFRSHGEGSELWAVRLHTFKERYRMKRLIGLLSILGICGHHAFSNPRSKKWVQRTQHELGQSLTTLSRQDAFHKP